MQHLLLDLLECDERKLADADGLRRFLDELPDRLGLKKVGPASLFFIDAVTDPRDAGHSGLILSTNHVSLHSWPPYRMINIDIFSRDPFDEALALAFARAAFDAGDIEVHSVQRATRSLHTGEGAEKPAASVTAVEGNRELSPNVAHCCLWSGGCMRSTGSALMKYCALHKDLLLPP